MPQIQFILFMPDIPVVLQRRAHSANCAEDRRDPTDARVQFWVGFDMPVVVRRLAPGGGRRGLSAFTLG